MFDLRYHVASLAAVFLMLVVGILIGVGISGRGFVDDAERNGSTTGSPGSRSRSDAAKATADDFERRQKAAQDFVETAYPVLVERPPGGEEHRRGRARLASSRTRSRFVESAIGKMTRRPARADAGPDAAAAARCNRSRRSPTGPSSAATSATSSSANLGRDLGRELVTGGETPLWDALAGGDRRGAVGRPRRIRSTGSS